MWNGLSIAAAFLGGSSFIMVIALYVHGYRRDKRVQLLKYQVSDRLATMGLLSKSLDAKKRQKIMRHIIWIRGVARRNCLTLAQLGTSERALDKFRDMMEHGSSSCPVLARMPVGFAPADSWRFGSDGQPVGIPKNPAPPSKDVEIFIDLTDEDTPLQIEVGSTVNQLPN